MVLGATSLEIIDNTLLTGTTLAEPYESLFVNVPDNIIQEIGDDQEMAYFCQFPKIEGCKIKNDAMQQNQMF